MLKIPDFLLMTTLIFIDSSCSILDYILLLLLVILRLFPPSEISCGLSSNKAFVLTYFHLPRTAATSIHPSFPFFLPFPSSLSPFLTFFLPSSLHSSPHSFLPSSLLPSLLVTSFRMTYKYKYK